MCYQVSMSEYDFESFYCVETALLTLRLLKSGVTGVALRGSRFLSWTARLHLNLASLNISLKHLF